MTASSGRHQADLHSDHEHAHPNDHAHDLHSDHEHAHPTDHAQAPRRSADSLLSVMVPFGAAASPDLTILPVFLAATMAGAGVAIGSVVVFGAVTIVTIVGLTLFVAAGGYQVRGQWLDRWGNVFTAVVLVVIGTLGLTGVISRNYRPTERAGAETRRGPPAASTTEGPRTCGPSSSYG